MTLNDWLWVAFALVYLAAAVGLVALAVFFRRHGFWLVYLHDFAEPPPLPPPGPNVW